MMSATTDTRTIWQLTGLAACADPDSNTSPGAQFLRLIEDGATEAAETADVADDLSDAAHQIADVCVPIYTHQLWQTFVDLAAYREDLDDIGGTTGDMERDAMAALYMIGNRLAMALLEELTETNDDDNETEEDDQS